MIAQNDHKDYAVAWPQAYTGAAIGIITACYLYWHLGYGIDYYDTGYVLYPAKQIFEGKVLYKQIQTLYTPAIYYWHAFLFWLLGPQLSVAKGALVSLGAATAVLMYLVAVRLVPQSLAIIPPVYFLFWGIGLHPAPHPDWYIIFLSLVLLWAIDGYLKSESRSYLWATSFLVGIIAVFKQNMGVYHLIWLLAWAMVCRWQAHCGIKKTLMVTVPVIVGAAIPFLGFLIYFWSQGALADFLNCAVFSISNQGQISAKSFEWLNLRGGTLLALFLTLTAMIISWQRKDKTYFLLALLGAGVTVVCAWSSGLLTGEAGMEKIFRYVYDAGRNLFANVLVLGCLAGLMGCIGFRRQLKIQDPNNRFTLFATFAGVHLLKLFPRADFAHFLFIAPAILLFFCVGLYTLRPEKWLAKKHGPRNLIGRRVWFVIFLGFLPGIQLMHDMTRFIDINSSFQNKTIARDKWVSIPMPQGDAFYLEPERASSLMALVRFVDTHLAPSEKIYIYPNETFLYLLLDRETALPRYTFFPGEMNKSEEQQVLAKLQGWRPNYIIEGRLTWDGHKDFRNAHPLIYNYIQDNYRIQRDFAPEDLRILSRTTSF
jgi:hypothetical protein